MRIRTPIPLRRLGVSASLRWVRKSVAVSLLLLPAIAGAAPPMRGVAIGLYGDADPGAAFAEIASLGATHVGIAVFWRQRDVRAVELAPDAAITVPDERLRAAIRRARAAGLRVFLLPIVDVERRKLGEWRGTLAPADVELWWRAYQSFILHYAGIAATEDVALFSVGSELASTESWRDRWFALISKVQRRYQGQLVYSANWDHFKPVSFWNRLDYVGVTGYHELTGDKDAAVDELTASFRRARDELVAFAREAGRPLLITEVGWPSQDGAATRPWDYTTRAAVDLEEQRRCYAAFAAAWDGGELAGVFFWDWNGAGGPGDPHYTPRGKPAEAVLRRWFADKVLR